MHDFPISYIEPVFRPPSEAHSLILPVTNGCSWNQCGFCEMYTQPQKKFRARDEAEVLEEIRRCGERLIVQRVFLADGDALVLPTRRLMGSPIFVPYLRLDVLPHALEMAIARVPDPALRLTLARAASANLAWQRSTVVSPPMQSPLPGLMPPDRMLPEAMRSDAARRDGPSRR